MKKLISLCLVAACAAVSAITLNAADKKPTPAEKSEKKAARALPFQGKVSAVDATAKTIKVGERTFHATAQTRITKAGKPATLADAKAGEEVGISYREGEGGKLELGSLRIGPKPEKQPKEDKK